MTQHRPAAPCAVEWPGKLHAHECAQPVDHRQSHECACGICTWPCGAEYRASERSPGDRIVACHLALNHPGDHQEAVTGITWHEPLPAPPAEPAQPPTTDAHVVDLRRVSGYLVDGEVYQPRDVEILMRPDTSVDYAGPHTNVLERAPAGLTPEQTIRHHAIHEAGGLALARGAVDPPVFWDDVTSIAAYIRDGSRP